MLTGDIEKIIAIEKAIDVNTLMSVTNIRGVIINVNKMFCKISKYSREELIGQSHSIINSKHHPQAFFKEMWKVILSGKTWRGEIKNKAKDGEFYWVDTVIVPVLNSIGEISEFVSLRFLITDKIITEEKILTYIKQLEDLSIYTSHVIRSPLTQLMGIINLIEKDDLTAEEMEKIAAYMKESVEKLNEYTIEMSDKLEKLKNEFKAIEGQSNSVVCN